MRLSREDYTLLDKKRMQNATNTVFMETIFSLAVKYNIFTDEDIVILTSEKSHELFGASTKPILLEITDLDETTINKRIHDEYENGRSVTRYYRQPEYRFGKRVFVASNDMYGKYKDGEKRSSDNRTPLYEWFISKIDYNETREIFFDYLGGKNSLAGYNKSYKLVFFKIFFESEYTDGLDTKSFAEQFRQYYITRKQKGLRVEIGASSIIQNVTESSVEDVLGLIMQNPYKAISSKGFFAERDNRFFIDEELKNVLSSEDISEILSIVEAKLELYFSQSEEWWPSLEEYTPGLTKDDWLEMLNDGTTFTDNAYFAIAAMYDFGGIATCRQLEEKYGKTSDFYKNCLGTQLASKVKQKYDLPYCMQDEENSKVWSIVFQGRNATANEQGNYVWKIRSELSEALSEFGIEKYLIKEEGEEKLSTRDTIDQVKKYIASKGFSYNNDLIENFYLSLKAKPFVILAGTSGTGKTKLVKLFAEAIGAKYKLVSVRPDWSDSSDLFGHTNLKGEFVKGAITEYVKEAQLHQDYPYFLCLDEMNLARVEYYLSDFLSLIETRKWEDGKVITEPIELEESAKKEFKGLYLPENLYIVGTVNMDETTFPFSKKVLDRANTIEFSYVDLIPEFEEVEDKVYPVPQNNAFLKTEFLNLKADIKNEQRDVAVKVCEELQAINEILQDANSHVGYRVRDEIVFYMINNEKLGLLQYKDALDNEIMQKILPRIQGSSNGVKELLCKLFKKFAGDYSSFSQDLIWKQMDSYIKEKNCIYRNSATKICYMMRRYEEDGFTSYWL